MAVLSHLEKLLAVASLGEGAYGRWLSQRLIASGVVVASLTIIISVMFSVLMLVGFYAGYYMLVAGGMPIQDAMFIIFGAFLATLAALIGLTVYCLNRLRHLPEALVRRSPIAAKTADVIDAFMDGFKRAG